MLRPSASPVSPERGTPAQLVTVGIHVGRRITTVAVADLDGNVLGEETLHRERGEAPDLPRQAQRAAAVLGRLPGRTPLAVGLVGPWRELGLDAEQLGDELRRLIGLPVRTADHIAAMAATEFLHRRRATPGVTLYVYARETVGFAVAVDRHGRTEVARVGSLTHFPTGGAAACPCGRTGCMEAEAGDEAVARAAVSLGVVREPSIHALHAAVDDPVGRNLLRARARVLGRVAASVRDMIDPDRVVLVGQAFTGWEPVLDEITVAFEQTTTRGAVPLSFTRFGADVQAVAACTVALGPLDGEPATSVPSRRTAVRAG